MQEIKNQQYRNIKSDMFARVQTYLTMSGCRRDYFLNYFEDEENDQFKIFIFFYLNLNQPYVINNGDPK